MNPEVKKKWIEALRSGEFQQGFHRLRNTAGTRFCCLGVLCELHRREFPTIGRWTEQNYYETAGFSSYEVRSSYEVLPRSVVDWAGLPAADPDVPDECMTLASANDGLRSVKTHSGREPKSFEEIARIIEEKF